MALKNLWDTSFFLCPVLALRCEIPRPHSHRNTSDFLQRTKLMVSDISFLFSEALSAFKTLFVLIKFCATLNIYCLEKFPYQLSLLTALFLSHLCSFPFHCLTAFSQNSTYLFVFLISPSNWNCKWFCYLSLSILAFCV